MGCVERRAGVAFEQWKIEDGKEAGIGECAFEVIASLVFYYQEIDGSEARGVLDLRIRGFEFGREGCGRTAPGGEVAVVHFTAVEVVDAVFFGKPAVDAEFVVDPQADEKCGGHANGEAGNIDGGETFIAK